MTYQQKGPKQPPKHEYSLKQKIGDKWQSVGYGDKKTGATGVYLSIGINRNNVWENYLLVKNEQQPQQAPQIRQAVPPQQNFTRQAPPANWPPKGNDDPSDLGI